VRSEPRLPAWLTRPLGDPARIQEVRKTISAHGLNTVCSEARCPNRGDCFGRGTATFMILGDRCTRDCAFCSVGHGAPEGPDPGEPAAVAAAAASLGLSYVVVTSVTRDDLRDGGAASFAETIREIRGAIPHAGVEVLVPDFEGRQAAIDTVLHGGPDVFGHNVETVERLYEGVREGADYRRTLDVLSHASRALGTARVKSALMLGLGERREEIEATLEDLRAAGVGIVYLGQYLRPSRAHRPVARFVHPDEFREWERRARAMGFSQVSAGPFVRSSYRAEETFARARTTAPGSSGAEKRPGAKERERSAEPHHA